MKQFALTLCMVLLSVMFCRAQIKPLKFDKNGEFKIVQFTDVHFKYGNPASDIALKRINEVLDAERSLFSTQQTLLDLIYARQVNEINLFTALGGGWVE